MLYKAKSQFGRKYILLFFIWFILDRKFKFLTATNKLKGRHPIKYWRWRMTQLSNTLKILWNAWEYTRSKLFKFRLLQDKVSDAYITTGRPTQNELIRKHNTAEAVFLPIFPKFHLWLYNTFACSLGYWTKIFSQKTI